MPKLGSRKTRTGCAQCKQRRVKCDEGKPQCSNCSRYGQICQYLPTSAASRPARTPVASRTSLSPIVGAETPSYASQQPTFDQLDVSLFHYWTVRTCKSVSRFPHLDIWQLEIPRLAYQHAYLMQGIIAVAALHRAHNESNLAEVCINRAVRHLSAGLPRLMELVSNLENESPDAIIAFTAIVAIYHTSLPSVRNVCPSNPLGSLLEVFQLVQGTKDVVGQTWERALAGPLRAMFHSGIFDQTISPARIARQPRMLQDIIEQLDLIEPLLSSWSGADQSSIAEAISSLRNLRLLVYHELATEKLVDEPSNLFLWPAFCTPGVMRLFHARKGPAIAVLAHYAFILDSTRWSLTNWRSWLLNAIADMEFEEPWQSIIQWPVDKFRKGDLPKLVEITFAAHDDGRTNHDNFQ